MRTMMVTIIDGCVDGHDLAKLMTIMIIIMMVLMMMLVYQVPHGEAPRAVHATLGQLDIHWINPYSFSFKVGPRHTLLTRPVPTGK
jgi:hypothetical protein